MKKYGKMSSIFEFSTSRLGYVAIFIKIGVKRFWPFFKTFLTNQGKNEDEVKKIWENEFDFWISMSRLGYVAIFIKIQEKKFWPIF